MEQTNIYTACRESLGKEQNSQEVEVVIENGLVGKVLCLNSYVVVDDSVALQGEIAITGSIFTNLVYLNEVGELKNQKQTTPFNIRVENESVNPMSNILLKSEVVESAITLATESVVRANIILEITIDNIAQKEVSSYVSSDNNIKTKTEKCLLTNVKTSNKAKFNVMAEQSLKINTNEIIVSSVNTNLKNIISGTGYFTLEGEVCVNFMAQSQDEDKPIKCFTEILTFKEEIENEALTKEDLILAYISPDLDGVVLELTQGENKVQFNISIPQNVNYVALNKTEQEFVVDAFSVNCDANLEYKNIPCCEIKPTKFLESRIDGNFTILDTEPRIAKLTCVSPNNVALTKTYAQNEMLIIEGIAHACVSYETDDDDTLLASVQAEIPFSCSFKNVVNENDSVFVVASVCGASAKAKKGKEIDLDLDLVFGVDTYSHNSKQVLNSLTLGECNVKSEYALKVHVAPEGSTLWELCKKLKTSEEVILEQNPTLTFPLENPTSIIYFKGRKAE